jgi:crotonobetainyl-CoA:carnitine CoA-transferase CaiB-like acyl-CoA transferase
MPVSALSDITVVECSTFVTGPYAAALLADFGARVVKIESPPDGDPYRYFAPDSYFSSNFAHLNRNKESLALDLKTEEGKRVCLELVKKADVFVENFRPGTAERLEENDVPAGPLYNIAEAVADEQVAHLDLVEDIQHPKAGKLDFVGSGVSYAGLSKTRGKPPPLLGEQTAAIKRDKHDLRH